MGECVCVSFLRWCDNCACVVRWLVVGVRGVCMYTKGRVVSMHGRLLCCAMEEFTYFREAKEADLIGPQPNATGRPYAHTHNGTGGEKQRKRMFWSNGGHPVGCFWNGPSKHLPGLALLGLDRSIQSTMSFAHRPNRSVRWCLIGTHRSSCFALCTNNKNVRMGRRRRIERENE